MSTSTPSEDRSTIPHLRPLPIAAAPMRASNLGQFEILTRLGGATEPCVYLAQTRDAAQARRLVAIKHITRNHCDPVQWRFAAEEARVGARLLHANVVRVFGVEDSEAGPFIVMNYVEGGTLADLLRRCFEANGGRRGLPVALAIRIVLDALFGLHAAHELRDEHGEATALAHCNVCPGEVLVGADGVSRITSSGIARAGRAVVPAARWKARNAGYLAPEQVLRRPVDVRTDVFAMGIVFWEALAGNRLFRGKRFDELTTSILEQRIASPSSDGARVPESVSAVCLRALERDPRSRWPSARAFADALTSAARAIPGMEVASQGEVSDYVERVLAELLRSRRAVIRATEKLDAALEGDVRLPMVTARNRVAQRRPRSRGQLHRPLERASQIGDRERTTVRGVVARRARLKLAVIAGLTLLSVFELSYFLFFHFFFPG